VTDLLAAIFVAFNYDLLYIINLRLDALLQKFLHTTEWGPAKRVSNRAPHLLAPALLTVKPNIASFQNT